MVKVTNLDYLGHRQDSHDEEDVDRYSHQQPTELGKPILDYVTASEAGRVRQDSLGQRSHLFFTSTSRPTVSAHKTCPLMMEQSPTAPTCIPGAMTRITCHGKGFIAVQTLFYERRYKQCIALCEQLQDPEIHGLHRTFLWFYHAVCYEAIGLLAHDFSQKKLHFLDSARESFGLAVKSFPLPFVSTEAGTYAQLDDSPSTPDINFSLPFSDKVVQATHATFPQTPRIKESSLFRSPSSIYSTASPLKAESISYCADQSPTRKGEPPTTFPTVAEPDIPKDKQLIVPETPGTHRTRPSRVLSSPQALQQELVPSPLFSRHAKQARVPNPANGTNVPRPLPPLPFNHNPLAFTIDGTRITQAPHLRKTAVQTLIARFEGILPLPPSTPLTTIVHSTPSTTPDIATPRFRMISDAFSPDPRNEHLETYLTSTAASAHLARYNAKLADFRVRLKDHIAYLDGELTRVQKMQNERQAAKQLLGPKQRYASFWSFEAASSPCPRRRDRPMESKYGDGSEHNGSQAGDEVDEVRDRHGDGDGDGAGDQEGEDAKAKAKKERMARLRQQGWRVRKENHGFKGVQFYDNLCRCVETELNDSRLFA
ncbi:hypothetical protein A1O7_07011 [Cladophialophora yegresii CBS 114405]|uniref:Uncharacterized protein n=1 Tax=Cladophialophora yegresii CBS 114405 TaxID=1182544 RepID=W9VLT3_9EURO|nr:uncharacterized protein A1O7_07011 [Cladophialophora yegresii CBS 114405]EXJ56667.1 hypothetical protein A1O7_07011 [Cladophialophora yegresii CBS 114405]